MVSSSKWSILSEVGTRTIAPLSFLVLANFLTPDDFGIVALATIMVSFAQILWDSGMSKALIQRTEDIKETANIVFFCNILLAFWMRGSGFFLLSQSLSDMPFNSSIYIT
jgi:PST family polysaccharide transporter